VTEGTRLQSDEVNHGSSHTCLQCSRSMLDCVRRAHIDLRSHPVRRDLHRWVRSLPTIKVKSMPGEEDMASIENAE
jgi:hypothetical protein